MDKVRSALLNSRTFVPLGSVIAAGILLASIIWWAASITAKLNSLLEISSERATEMKAQVQKLDALERSIADVKASCVALDVRLQVIEHNLGGKVQ